MRTEHEIGLGDVSLTDSAAGRAAALTRPAVGLVSPLPPQVGVASFAEWLLAHEAGIGCRFVTFDLERPSDAPPAGKLDAGPPPGGARRACSLGAPRASVVPLRLLHDDRPRPRRCLRGAPARGRAAGDRSRPWRLARRGRHVGQCPPRPPGLAPRPGHDHSASSAAALESLGVEAEWVMNPVRAGVPAGTARAELEALRVLFGVPTASGKAPRPPARRAPGA